MDTYVGKSTIGLRDVCYAMLTETDDGFEYGPVNKIAGAIDVSLTTSPAAIKQYADDGTYDIYSALGDMTLAFQLAALPSEVQKDWLGFTIDTNGAVNKSKDAQGGYFALGFRAAKSDGKSVCRWLKKCKALVPGVTAHTTEGSSATFQATTVNLECAPRVADGSWESSMDEGDTGINAAAFATFLNDVYETAAPTGG